MTETSFRRLIPLLLATLFAGLAAASAQHYHAPTRARFTIDSRPQGAAVTVDGKPCGTTPVDVVLTYRLWNPCLAKDRQQLTRAERDEAARRSTRFEVVLTHEGYAPASVTWTAAEYLTRNRLECELRREDVAAGDAE